MPLADWAGGISSLVGTGLGLLLEKHNDRRQLRQQEQLQQLGIRGAKEMTDYQQSKQLEMWEKTGPQGQMEQLKKAGLNPSLIYGMGGAGGQTIGASAASVSQGSAPQGGGETMQGIQMGLQLQMQQAQIKLAEAQARKAEADANKTNGVDTAVGWATVSNLNAGTKDLGQSAALKEVQIIYQGIANQTATLTQNNVVKAAEQAVDKATIELNLLRNQQKISDETVATEIATVKANFGYLIAKTHESNQNVQESKSRVAVNEQQIKKLINDIYVANEQLKVNQGQLTETQKNNLHYRQNANLTDLQKLIGEGAVKAVQSVLGKF